MHYVSTYLRIHVHPHARFILLNIILLNIILLNIILRPFPPPPSPVHVSQMFVLDGAVLPKSSAQQLLTLLHIDTKECSHRIGAWESAREAAELVGRE